MSFILRFNEPATSRGAVLVRPPFNHVDWRVGSVIVRAGLAPGAAAQIGPDEAKSRTATLLLRNTRPHDQSPWRAAR